MRSTSETGYAKDVGNFAILTQFCIDCGQVYNPSNPAISLASLTALQTEAEARLEKVRTALNAWNLTIDERDAAFTGLRPLSIRIINALSASGAPLAVIDDAKSYHRKLMGRRASPRKQGEAPADPAQETTGETTSEPQPEIRTRSSSQLSFDNRIENFSKLVDLLSSLPVYSPNEADLTVNGLTTTLNTLRTTNANVIKAASALGKARIDRDEIVYNAGTGLVATAGNVKKYIKSVFGNQSPQFRQISNLKF